MRTPLARILCVFVLLLPLHSRAAQLPPGIERVTEVEGITEYRLDNGLKVLLFPDPSKQTVTVNVTYMVGSRHESYGETGMAHLLEHLLFKGTPTHPNIPQELTERGARPNGTTSYDRTNYFQTLAANDSNLEWAIRMEADRMVNSFIAKRDLDSEMTVVRNEFEAGENNPGGVLAKRIAAAAFDWHNYGKVTIGNRSDIENVSIERLQAFYRKYYQSDNAALIVSGRFEAQRVLQLVADSFGKIPRPARVLERMYTVEPTQDGERGVTVRRVGDTQLVAAAYRVPSGAHADFAALDLLAFIAADTPSGRLHKALVDSKKAVSVSGYSYRLFDPGLLVFGVEVRKEQSLDEARAALLATLDELRRSPPSAEELERARSNSLKQIELTLNSSERLGMTLSNTIGMGDWRLFFLHRDRIRQVSAADVARVAAHYLRPDNRTIGQFIPTAQSERADIPATPDLAALLKDYKGDASVAAGETFDATPENIESRVVRETLPSGLKLALMPKKTRGGKVIAVLRLHFGDEQSLKGRRAAAGFVADLMLRGSQRLSRQQIEDELARLRAQLSIGGDFDSVSVSIEAARENFPATLRLAAQLLREPRFPAAEFEQLRQERLADIEQQLSEPRAAAMLSFARYLAPYDQDDIRYVPTFEEQIARVKAVKVEDVAAFYRDFYGASHGEFSVVGDFDLPDTRNAVVELYGDWASPRPYARIVKKYQDIAPATQTINTPDKANAFYVSGVKLNLRDDHPDYPALVLANEILGGGFLHSRFATRIRQKEGLSYGVGSRLMVDSRDPVGRFSTYAIYAPQNVARLETAFADELSRVLREGFTEDEIAKAKAGLLQAHQVTRSQDGSLAAALATYLHLGRTMAWDTQFEQRMEQLSAQGVLEALKRHVDPARFIVVKAGDFPKP